MKHLLPLLLVPLLLAGPVDAKGRRKKVPPVDPKVAELTAPLIKNLDSPSYKERETATRALKSLGTIAEPALRAALPEASLEVRSRISRILMHYREMARREKMGTPGQGDWPMLRRSPARDAGDGSAMRELPDVSWFADLPGRVGKPWFDSPFLVVGNHVIVVLREGKVISLSRDTGKIEWVTKTGEQVFAGPVMAAGVIYVPGSSLVAIDARRGKILWRWKTDYGVTASPLVFEGRVFAVEKGERLVSLDPADGKVVWRRRLPATHSSPVPVQGMIVVGARDGLRAYRAKDGQRRWVAETRQSVEAPPVVLPDRIVFADKSKALYAVTIDRGKMLWRRRFPEGEVVGSPAVYGDAILFPTSGATFRAIHAKDGSDMWIRWIGTVVISSPSVVDGTLYFMGGPILFAMECADGDDVWRKILPVEDRFAAPVLLDDTLYLLGMEGVMTAYRTDVK